MATQLSKSLKTAFFLVTIFLSIGTAASGVFIVKGGSNKAYNDAVSGFLQMAYALKLPGFQPAVVELKRDDSDTATLQALKSRHPALVYTVGSYATKSVRSAMPDTWIVYAMVYYPEVEGFNGDPKMVGVSAFGSADSLFKAVKAFGNKYKSMVVINSPVTQQTVGSVLIQLNKAGFDAQGRSVSDPSKLKDVFDGLGGKFRTVMILPDPLTARPEALRFIISRCIERRLLLVSLTDSLTSKGVLCSSFLSPTAGGNLAAKVASAILNSGKAPPGRFVAPKTSPLSINYTTLSAIGLKKPKRINFEVSYE